MKFSSLINLKKNNYKIFLFHGVITKNNYVIRNYTNKHLTEKKFYIILRILKKL